MSRIRFLPPRGTATDHASFTGDAGELTVNTTDWSMRVHDGSTVGGHLVGGVSALIGLSDVALSSPANGDTLVYDTATSQWKNHAGGGSLAFSSLTGVPTTLAGYGITDSVIDTLTISAGTGLSGGGNLTVNRTLALANMAANTLKGNNTGSSAAPGDLTVAQVKSLLAIATTDISGLAASATTDTTNAANISSGTLAAARLPAFSGGDVTASAGSVNLQIVAGAVGLTEMANFAANSIMGNNTGSAATPLALSVSQVKTLLGLATSATTDTTNAANISSGTLPSARLSGSYTGITAVGSISGTLAVGGGSITLASARDAIADLADTWLRLNNSSSYTSGIFSPGKMRIDGNVTLGGTLTTVSGGAAYIRHATSTSGTVTVQSGGTASGGASGDIFLIY